MAFEGYKIPTHLDEINIKCPHCDYGHPDSWEKEDDADEMDCHSCGKPFRYERDTTVTYSTWLS